MRLCFKAIGTLLCLVLCLGAVHVLGQDAVPRPPDAQPNVAQLSVVQLSKDLQQTRSELADSKREIEELRRSLEELRKQVESGQSAPSLQPVPASASEPTVASADQ